MQRLDRAASRRTVALVLATAALAAAATGQLPARADTESDLQDAMAEVEQLQDAAARSHEEYEAAGARLAATEARLAELDVALQAAVLDVDRSRQSVGRAARASYMSGGVEGSLFLLLAADPDSFGRTLNDVQRVSDAAVHGLAQAQRSAEDLAAIRSQIAAAQATEAQLRDEAARAAAAAAAALEQAQQREDALQQRFAAEVAAARAAEQLRAQQEAQAARQQAALSQLPAVQPAAPAPAPPTALGAAGRREVSDRRAAVVAWALDRVGSRYVLNAEGPDAFDCSGFATAAYRTVGVSVPSYTGAQAKQARPVPLAQAKPGDLLFYFGRGAQHVAIYLGDGRMVHAVNPSRGVTVNSLSDPWYRERFTTAATLID